MLVFGLPDASRMAHTYLRPPNTITQLHNRNRYDITLALVGNHKGHWGFSHLSGVSGERTADTNNFAHDTVLASKSHYRLCLDRI